MPAIKTKIETVRRVTCIYREREPGYLPDVERRDFQEAVTVTKIFGIPIRVDVTGREEIPQHAVLSNGCFGDAGGWRSRFSALIKRCRDNGIPPARGVIYRHKPAFCE